MINLIPGKLYRAAHRIWGMYKSGHDGVVVDLNEVIMFVGMSDEEFEFIEAGYVAEFLFGDKVIVMRKANSGYLEGPL